MGKSNRAKQQAPTRVPDDDTAKEGQEAAKKQCTQETPQRMKKNGGVMATNGGMTDQGEDDSTNESNTKKDLLEVFDLPDVTDPSFWDGKIKGETEKWDKRTIQLTENTGYRKADMFSDDEYSLTKLIHVGHRVMKTNGKGEIQPIDWLDMFNKALTKGNYDEKVSTQLQVMALRLAKV